MKSSSGRTRMTPFIVTLVSLVLAFASATHAQTTKLTVWDWWSPNVMGDAIADWWDFAKEKFEREHPGVEVEILFVSDVYDKLVTASAAGIAPDVSQLSVSYARDLYEAGLLLPLNDYVEKTPELDPSQFFPVANIFNSKGSVIYAIPHNLDKMSLFYNTDFLDEAGLDSDPFAIDSWDTFRDYAKKLTRLTGSGEVARAGFHSSMNTVNFQTWLYANGGDFYNESQDGLVFASENGIEALEFMRELESLGFTAPAGSGHVLATGRTAMMLDSGFGTRYPDINSGTASLPPGPSGDARAVTGWVNMIAIPSGSKNPDLAWKWVTFFTGLQGQLKFFEIYKRAGVPRIDFFQSDAWAAFTEENPFIRVLPHLLESAREYPFIKYRDINGALTPRLQQVSRGELAPRAALTEAQRVGNAFFDE